jgi:hypothetical protein
VVSAKPLSIGLCCTTASGSAVDCQMPEETKHRPLWKPMVACLLPSACDHRSNIERGAHMTQRNVCCSGRMPLHHGAWRTEHLWSLQYDSHARAWQTTNLCSLNKQQIQACWLQSTHDEQLVNLGNAKAYQYTNKRTQIYLLLYPYIWALKRRTGLHKV